MSPSVVQAKLITGASSGSFASATGTGNAVVLLIGADSGGNATAPAVSGCTLGGAAGNFASLGANAVIADAAGNPGTMCAVWIDPDAASGKTAIAVTMSSGTCDFIWALEVSGLNSSPSLDAHASVDSTAGTTTWSSGATGTTTAADELVLGMAGHGEFVGSGTTLTGPSSPWVNSSSFQTGGYVFIAGYQLATATGTFTYSGDSGSSFDFYTALCVTIKPSAGSTPVSGSDTASAAESSSIAVTLSGSDSASAAESSSIAVTLSGTDSASAAEHASVSTGGTPISGTDAASAAESGSVSAALSGTDTASAAESASVSGGTHPFSSDSAIAAESALVSHRTVSGSDSVSAAESARTGTGGRIYSRIRNYVR